MKILVTGGCGFFGSSICISLKIKYPSYKIIAFDNLKRSGSEINLIELRSFGIEFIHGDIRNIEDIELAGEFDILVDCSAEPSVTSGIGGKPDYVINNNLFGSINCFNACLKYDAKLIFISTSRVYPVDQINNISYTEDSTRFNFIKSSYLNGSSHNGISEEFSLYGPRSFYGTTKLSAELLIQEYSEFYNLKASIVRFGVIAGPRQMGKIDQGVSTLWMAKHFWKKPLNYIGFEGKGKQVRDILHINDAVDLIDLQIHKINLFNKKIFNAGGGFLNSISLLEMTNLCEKITGNKLKIDSIKQNRSADMRIYYSDNSKIYSHTGWQPKYSIDEIFRDIFKWIKENENQLKDLLS